MGKRNLPRRQFHPTTFTRKYSLQAIAYNSKYPLAGSCTCYPMMQPVTIKQLISNTTVKTF